MDPLHVIHCRNGRIGPGTDTSPADLDALVDALRADGRGHLVLHIHGGLVSKTVGLDIVRRLKDRYAHHGYPVFMVWESGFFETLRNNFRELADEPVFRELVRKVLEYALGRLGGTDGARAIAPGAVDPREVRRAVDAFFDQPSAERVPYRGFAPLAPRAASRSAADGVDVAEIQADLETDDDFARALATLPDLKPGSRSVLAAGAPVAEHRSAFSEAVADCVASQPGSRGVVSWLQVAMLVARILVAVLRRHGDRRDHGLYATTVEEIARGVRLAGSGLNEWGKALQWNRMKQDAADAFGSDPAAAGTALFQRLRAAMDEGLALPRITLVGHSTGAIWIAHALAAADRLLPAGVRFEVVFLAPAITHELWARTLDAHGARIAQFRMFAMSDALERDDQVWGTDDALDGGRDWRRFVYPSSLLYLVSGILESRIADDGEAIDEADMPLVGMQRFHTMTEVYGEAAFPAVARVRAWLDAQPGRVVWAHAAGQPAGLNCGSIDHGSFDEDGPTLESLDAVLQGW